jgi:hypothetical protein
MSGGVTAAGGPASCAIGSGALRGDGSRRGDGTGATDPPRLVDSIAVARDSGSPDVSSGGNAVGASRDDGAGNFPAEISPDGTAPTIGPIAAEAAGRAGASTTRSSGISALRSRQGKSMPGSPSACPPKVSDSSSAWISSENPSAAASRRRSRPTA